jgi:hypothetical protein
MYIYIYIYYRYNIYSIFVMVAHGCRRTAALLQMHSHQQQVFVLVKLVY